MPSQETLAAAGAALAEEAARNAAAVGQWMAVAVAVDPEEAARSLEEEMFKTLAHPAAGGDSSTVSKPAADSSSAATASTEAAPPAASSVETPPAIEKTEDVAAEEPAAVTFADAVRRDEEPSKAEPVAKDSGAGAGVPGAGTTTISNSNVAAGGEESMGKENGKSGKSNWHQIRTATPAAKDALEAAKQVEEAPKAMAAAADGTRTAPTDPTAIANIVDSVLADLRPKIVEEISKKLAGK
jgi:hypothetical protein